MKGRWLPTLMVAGSLLAAITTGRLRIRTSPRSAAALNVASILSPVMCVAWRMRSVRPTPCCVAATVLWVPRIRAGGSVAPTPKLRLRLRCTPGIGHDGDLARERGRASRRTGYHVGARGRAGGTGGRHLIRFVNARVILPRSDRLKLPTLGDHSAGSTGATGRSSPARRFSFRRYDSPLMFTVVA